MKEQRYDVDWPRVVATPAIFLFHSARFFDTEAWELKFVKAQEGLAPVSAMNILIFLVLGWVFQFLSGYISRKHQVSEGA